MTRISVTKRSGARRAAFLDRMAREGRHRRVFWLTNEEAKRIEEELVRKRVQLQLQFEFGVRLEPDAIFREPVALSEYTVVEISPTFASLMVRLWHSRLPHIPVPNIIRNRHSACYAMVCSGFAHAVAVYTSPVARYLDDGATVELRRLAMSARVPKNSATWFMAQCEKLLRKKYSGVKRMVTYQDMEVHHGTIYKAGNWQRSGEVFRSQTWARQHRPGRFDPIQKTYRQRWVKALR